MTYNRPEIDTQNLENDRLKPEEYGKARDYVKGLILGATKGLISEQKELGDKILDQEELSLSDSNLLEVFKTSREAYSFLGTLPEGDVVAIMREIFFGGLEKELEDES